MYIPTPSHPKMEEVGHEKRTAEIFKQITQRFSQ